MKIMPPSLPAYFSNLPRLESRALVLRPLAGRDLLDMWEYLSDPLISEFTTWEYHQDMAATLAYLESVLGKQARGEVENWGIELQSEGKLVGMAGFGNVDETHRHGEIGYVLSRKYWNRGIMSEAVGLIVREGFSSLGLEKIIGRCIDENIGSRRVLEKAGFRQEGLLRRQFLKRETYRDIALYGLLRSESSADAAGGK
jgi:ribosomal-protein-alanine N-acetyltransferase